MTCTELVRAAVLEGRYSRTRVDLCAQRRYSINGKTTNTEIGFRYTVQEQSMCDGQGFAVCNCVQSGKQCEPNK